MKKDKEKVFSKVSKDGEIVFETSKKEDKKTKFEIPVEYMNLGLFIVTPILIGLFLGIYLDKRFDREYFFTILFLFIGIISSFYNLISLGRKIK